jgi:hypothetical protein
MLGVLHAAGAAGDRNVHVVGMNVGLAGVPVRVLLTELILEF